MPIALWALTVSAFAVGMTEFVIVGLLPIVAADLGVSLPSAGLLVSLYALGVTIGAPVLTAAAGRMQRKRLLLSLMALFIAGNAVASVSPSYEVLVLARFLTGLAHGVFFAIASTIATDLVPENKQSSAIAVVFLGLTVALVTGVPLGTWVGQAFGWQSTFLGVVALGLPCGHKSRGASWRGSIFKVCEAHSRCTLPRGTDSHTTSVHGRAADHVCDPGSRRACRPVGRLGRDCRAAWRSGVSSPTP